MEEFFQIVGAILEGLEGVVFGDDGGDDVHAAQHIHGLRLDDGHQHGGSTRLYLLDGSLHCVEARLIHKADEAHADNDNLSVVGDVGHDLFELVDGAEEDWAVEALDVDAVLGSVRHAAFVAPWAFFVEVGHFLTAVAALYEVGGALHEEDAGDDHANADSGEQVNKNGDEEDDDEDDGIGAWYLEQIAEPLEIDDAPADGDKDAGEDGKWHVFDQASEAEHDGEKQKRMGHAGELGAPTAFDVDDGAHGGAGTGKAAEETCNSVADALTDELAVGVVLCLCNIVCHDGGEESIDGAETREGETRDDGGHEYGAPIKAGEVDIVVKEERHGEARGDFTDDVKRVFWEEKRDHGHKDEGHESGGDFLSDEREEVDDRDSAEAEEEGHEFSVIEGVREASKLLKHRARAAATQ